MKILLYSPYQYIDVHALPEALVARELSLKGHDIFQVGCDGIFKNHCISMSAAGVWPADEYDKKNSICFECKKNRDFISNKFNFKQILIEDYIDEKDKSFIAEQLQKISLINWTDFMLDGVPIGRYASYEFLLDYKINTTELTSDQWKIYLIYFSNALKVFIAGKRIFESIQPDKLIVYNNFYSTNHLMCEIANQRSIEAYSLHAGSHHVNRLSQMTIFRGHKSQYSINRHPGWEIYKKNPMSIEAVKLASAHIHELVEANSPWVYSSKFSGIHTSKMKKHFGICEGKKVILVTMASADERFAATLVDGFPEVSSSIFKNQIEWLQTLIKWIRNQHDLHLIIRVHPREFPNKRESVTSKQGILLAELFANIPENVSINWPKDRISLYDLMRITDLGLNATSTAGMELILFGIPVVTHDIQQLFAYPPDMNVCCSSQDDYFLKIRESVNLGLRFSNTYVVYKWLAFKNEVIAIDISDGYEQKKWNFINWRLYRFMKFLGIYNKLPGLKKKNNLLNGYWLTYAIEKSEESHIMEYLKLNKIIENQGKVDIACVEYIKRDIIMLAKKIAPADHQFIDKITSLN